MQSPFADETADWLESLEDRDTWYENTLDSGSWVYSRWFGWQNTNAVVKNANCYWVTVEHRILTE